MGLREEAAEEGVGRDVLVTVKLLPPTRGGGGETVATGSGAAVSPLPLWLPFPPSAFPPLPMPPTRGGGDRYDGRDEDTSAAALPPSSMSIIAALLLDWLLTTLFVAVSIRGEEEMGEPAASPP